jgi:hypothetical protein
MTNNKNSLLEAALSYALMDWYVFPCKATDKEPLISKWQNKASNDAKQINEWWAKWPNANIAIHTGKSSLVVLDVDPRNGGNESLQALLNSEVGLQLSPVKAKSGGAGEHYYYMVNGDLTKSLVNTLGNGLDVLHGNKYVIAPPSIHPSGGLYLWLNSEVDDEL